MGLVLQTIEHGTMKGYRAERRAGIPTCDRCRRANAEYTQHLRQTNGSSHKARLAYSRAHNAALAELKKIHPYEYSKLLDKYLKDERDKLGI